MSRPSWDDTFFNVAEEISKRSTCLRRQYGCVIVRDKHIISSGYNGAPRGCPHCLDIGCAREGYESGTHHELCRAVHAEQNAVALAAREGINIKGGELYIKDIPCTLCTKILINAGISTIHYISKDYPDHKESIALFLEAGIRLIEYNK